MLLPATEASLRAEIAGDVAALAAALDVAQPAAWPPELFDADAARYSLDLLAQEPLSREWGLRYFALKRGGAPQLVGAGGYKGPPRDGFVEVGYSILHAHRRRGYATEATRGLAARAFAKLDIDRVLAHTLVELAPSIGVLEKLEFKLCEDTLEEGAIMFALSREDWERQA